jgi:hypothetical protein
MAPVTSSTGPGGVEDVTTPTLSDRSISLLLSSDADSSLNRVEPRDQVTEEALSVAMVVGKVSGSWTCARHGPGTGHAGRL